MTLLWLLAFIQKPKFQHVYYKGIEIINYIGWALGLWVLIAFILGADEVITNPYGENDTIGYNIMYGLIYVAVMIAMQMGAGYGLGPGAMDYYRWADQEWWVKEDDMEMDVDMGDM